MDLIKYSFASLSPIVNLNAFRILYSFISLKIIRFLPNFLKAFFALIFVSSKFIKKKFAVGSFVLILHSFKTENIFFDHYILCSIALFVQSLSLIASTPAASAVLFTLNGGLIWYIASIISFEEYPQPNLKPAKP